MTVPKLIARPPITTSSYKNLLPDRFDKIHLYESSSLYQQNHNNENQNNSSNSENNNHHWRYELTILDRNVTPPPPPSITNLLPCAVFLIPAGRESEYIFRTKKGLFNVAESANCIRLIAVSFHRNHVYISQEYVQRELERTIQLIAQRGIFWKHSSHHEHNENLQIPFLAVDGIGKRNIIAEGDTSTTGPFVVEEVNDPNHDNNNDENQVGSLGFIRRLYFLNNPNVIQSEIFVKKKKQNYAIEECFDITRLAFEYHKHLSAGILGFTFHPQNKEETQQQQQQQQQQHLVIGLGGGGLVQFLHYLLPNAIITTVELDDNIVQIARSHFGFVNDQHDSIKVILGDGLTVCSTTTEEETNHDTTAQLNTIAFPYSHFSSISIDVDSKDNSCGMSCPPSSFISIPYLTKLKTLLDNKRGVLAMNVSARDPAMLRLVKQHVLEVFPSVFMSSNTSEEEENDLNVVIFATKTTFTLPVDKLDFVKLVCACCDENGISNTTVQSEMEECVMGIQQITIEDLVITTGEINQDKSTTSNKGNTSKKAGKKKGSMKKKKGNRK